MADTERTETHELLEQQRALAEFGAFALTSDDLEGILTEACRLVSGALRTDLAKVVQRLPGGKSMLVRAGIGWRPGVVGILTVPIADSAEGLTVQQGAVISPNIHDEQRFTYHDFVRQRGGEPFVNVLILGAEGRPPFGILQVDSRAP